jgi:hypothetical protein
VRAITRFTVCRDYDLLAREPIDAGLRTAGRWPTQHMALRYPTTRYRFLHRCFSQRALHGWHSEEAEVDEDTMECCTNCFVAVDAANICVSPASIASPLNFDEIKLVEVQRDHDLQDGVDARERASAPVANTLHATSVPEVPTPPAPSTDTTPQLHQAPSLIRVNPAPSLRVIIPPPAHSAQAMPAPTPSTPAALVTPLPPDPFIRGVASSILRRPSLPNPHRNWRGPPHMFGYPPD